MENMKDGHECYRYKLISNIQFKMDAPPLSEQELTEVYNWVDQIPLSRPKKNITRDFADGVLMAEIVSHYFPKLVELHNYIPSTAAATKLANWNTLNSKAFLMQKRCSKS